MKEFVVIFKNGVRITIKAAQFAKILEGSYIFWDDQGVVAAAFTVTEIIGFYEKTGFVSQDRL